MEYYLPLFILLAMLLLVVWQILLEFTFTSPASNRSVYRGLSAIYHKKYAAEISGGRMPDNIRQHILDILYRRRFDGLLIATGLLSLVFLFWVSPWVVEQFKIDKGSQAAAALYVAVLGLPIFTFVWFVRAYERDRELTREEADLWSGEFDRLMRAAASSDNEVLRRAAIRQLQDYLSGAKWHTNQRSNTTAIFELFSSVVEGVLRKVEEEQKNVSEAKQEPIVLTIGAVLRSVFSGQRDKPSRVRVSQNSLANFHLDLLDLTGVNLSELNIMHSTFMHADLTRANLFMATMSTANLANANLLGANLSEADLDYATLSKASMFRVNLSNADLFAADINGARLTKANLSGASLVEADLTRAILVQSNLTEADLTAANLTGANLTDADLSRANLAEAKLPQVNLTGTNLSGANLGGTGLQKEQVLKKFRRIKHNNKTKWDVPELDKSK